MLKIRIFSFSYLHSGLPDDTSGNGGGFVFDCRFIYNPGRHEEFNKLTGNDDLVKNFLEKEPEMQIFLKNVFNIIDPAVDNYLSRNFSDLMVSFGCTGGQHRSVYSANKLNEHIKQKYPEVETELIHYNL